MRGGTQAGTPAPCLWCLKPTRSPNRVCGEVCRTTERLANRTPSDDLALTGGEWRNIGGIQRWVPTTETVTEYTGPVWVPEPTPAAVPTLIACPTCDATVDQSCRTTTGNITTPHQDRVTTRRCRCGDVLAPRKQLCDECRVAARKETYRRREIRTPSDSRRRSKVAA